jgi:hypothetical protein
VALSLQSTACPFKSTNKICKKLFYSKESEDDNFYFIKKKRQRQLSEPDLINTLFIVRHKTGFVAKRQHYHTVIVHFATVRAGTMRARKF